MLYGVLVSETYLTKKGAGAILNETCKYVSGNVLKNALYCSCPYVDYQLQNLNFWSQKETAVIFCLIKYVHLFNFLC